MKTTIRFSITIFEDNRSGPLEYWNHEFSTTVDLPKWIPYEDREEPNYEDPDWSPPECEAAREKLLAREIKKAPRPVLWRGFVETVDVVDGVEVWGLGS